MAGLQNYLNGTDAVYQLVNGAYLLAIGAWVGAVVLMAALVAPAAFRQLGREQAGALVGLMVTRLQRWGVAVALFAFAASAWRGLGWEQVDSANFVLRSLPILGMAACSLVAATVVNPAAARLRSSLGPGWVERTSPDDPDRRAFRAAHRRSTRLLALSAICALLSILVQ
jgi:hypothetical protein